MSIIDAHVHLDRYPSEQQQKILRELKRYQIEGLVCVAMNLDSCKAIRELHLSNPKQVYPAYGFHPEQEIGPTQEMDDLFAWISKHQAEMVAIGEVGLPYYNRIKAEKRGESFSLTPYIALLDRFILLAKSLNKPIVLHAVYEDAEIACDLLEKHQVERAHFHWYKGPETTTKRMWENGYFISITPDILYERETQNLVCRYPLELIMVETDGPWPFEGPFLGQDTHPRMIHEVIKKIAELKSKPTVYVEQQLFENTKRFYFSEPL